MKRKCGLAVLILFVFCPATAMASPSHDAAAAGKVETLRQLLAEGADVNGKSDTGATVMIDSGEERSSPLSGPAWAAPA